MTDNLPLTPERIAEIQAYGQALLSSGQANEPSLSSGNPYAIASPMNIFMRAMQALQGRSALNLAENARATQRANLFSPNAGANPDPPASPFTTGSLPPNRQPTQNLTGDMSRYASAISNMESGGNYGAVGPKHPQLGRALGKYQVMEANLSPWLKEAGLSDMSPGEFLANPNAQDQLFNHRFGMYLQQFGNPTDAAQAWFAGAGSVGARNAGSRRDSLGTSVDRYRSSFGSHLARLGPQGSTPVAPSAANSNGALPSPMALGGPRPVEETNLPPVNPLQRNSPSFNRTPIPQGALEGRVPNVVDSGAQPQRTAQAAPEPNSDVPGPRGNQLPAGTPPRIQPDPNIQTLERQLNLAATMSQDEARKVYDQYLQLVGPQPRDVPGGVAYYNGRTGEFMYLVPKMGSRPVQYPGGSTQQQFIVGPNGVQILPTEPYGARGKGQLSQEGGETPPPSQNPNISPNLPPFPQSGDIGEMSQWGLNAQAQANIAERMAQTQQGIVGAAIEKATSAPAIINTLNIISRGLEAGGAYHGPTGQWALEASRFLSNFGWGDQSYLSRLPYQEIVAKLNAQLSSMAAQSLTSRPSSFDFNVFLQNNPGLTNSELGSRVLANILIQERQKEIAIGRIAQELRPNQFGDFQRRVHEYYEKNPTVINIPAHTVSGRQVSSQRVTTQNITTPEQARALPKGMGFYDPHSGVIRYNR
jgi:hypothetical protein